MKPSLLAVASVLAIVPTAHAGGNGYCPQPQQYAQQYSQSYYQPAYKQQYVEKVIYQFIPALSSDEYYGGVVGAQLRSEKQKLSAAQSQQDILGRVERLAAAIEGLQLQKVNTPPPLQIQSPRQPLPYLSPVAKPSPQVQPSPSLPAPAKPSPQLPDGSVPPPPLVPGPGPAPPPGAGAGEVPEAVMQILTAKCSKCHTAPAKAGGDWVMFSAEGVLAPLGPFDLLAIDQQVYSGAMPPDQPIPGEEYTALRAWINERSDEIKDAIKATKGR